MQILGAKEDARQLQIMLRKPLYRNRAINKLLTKRLGGTISHTSTRKLLKTKKELETELITLKEKNPRSEEVQILFAQIDEINFFLHERHSDTNSK